MTKKIVGNAQASQLLLQMIKEEMAQTLLHGEDNQEEEEGVDSQSNVESTAKMVNLADALLNNLDSHQNDEQLRAALFARLNKPTGLSKPEDQTSTTALESMESIENCSESGDGDSDDGMFWMHTSTYNTDSGQDVTHENDPEKDERSVSMNAEELDISERSPSNRTKNSSIQNLLSQFSEIVDAPPEEKLDDHDKTAAIHEIENDFDDEFVDDYSCISDITGGFKSQIPPPPPSLRASDAASRKKAVMIENLVKVQNSPCGVTDLHKKIRQPRWVRFDKVHIRYHKMIICDNPGNTGGGLSLGLGWRYHPVSMEKPVDEYEKERRRHRRRGSDLAWNRHEREQIALHHLKCTRKEMVDMVRQINRVKIQRRQTVNNLGAEKMEAAVENVSRKFKNLFTVKRA